MEKNEAVKELTEIRDLLKQDDITSSEALEEISRIMNSIDSPGTAPDSEKTNTQLKSFLVNFNVNNFSDASAVFYTEGSDYHIIESAGSAKLLDEFRLNMDFDHEFYRNTESIKCSGKTYRLFHETMELDSFRFTVLSLSESDFFRPSSFHILSDIVMDLIRLYRDKTGPVFSDFFETVIIDINSFLMSARSRDCKIYLFRFDHITQFLGNIGISQVIELSDSIVSTLRKFYGEDSGIFKISLTLIIVVTENRHDALTADRHHMISGLDFLYRGIVVPYRHVHIPYDPGSSIYTIFEHIFREAGHTRSEI